METSTNKSMFAGHTFKKYLILHNTWIYISLRVSHISESRNYCLTRTLCERKISKYSSNVRVKNVHFCLHSGRKSDLWLWKHVCQIKTLDTYRYIHFYTPEETFGSILLWRMSSVRASIRQSVCPSVIPSVSLSVRPAFAKSCPLINFKLISPRLTFLAIMDGYDP